MNFHKDAEYSLAMRGAGRHGTWSYFLKAVAACATVLVFVLVATGAAQSGHVDSAPTLSDSVSHFLDEISGLPLQYRADLTLNAISHLDLDDRRHFSQNLKDLFEELSERELSVPMGYATTGKNTLERVTSWSYSYSEVDSLTLEMRTLKLLNTIAPRLAVRDLTQLRLSLPAAECSEVLVPDVRGYYAALEELVGHPGVQLTNREIRLIEDQIQTLTSPLQIAPFVRLLSHVTVAPMDLQALVTRLAAKLDKLQATDRELGWMTRGESFLDALSSFDERLKREGVPRSELLRSVRDFLQRSLSSAQCRESSTKARSIVDQFNTMVADLKDKSSIDPLAGQGLFSRVKDPSPLSERVVPGTDEADALLGKMFLLRLERPSFMDSLADSGDRKHLAKWNEYSNQIKEISDRLGSDPLSCRECAWFAREHLLLSAFDLMPDDALGKRRLLREAISVLAAGPAEGVSAPLWVQEMKIVLNLSRPVSPEKERQLRQLRLDNQYLPFAPSSLQEEIKNEIQRTGSAVLTNYLRADLLFNNFFYAPYLDK